MNKNILSVNIGKYSFIASGIIQKTGSIEADVYDITEIFNHVKTDGEYWLNVHTNERLKDFNGYKKVFDFRIAVLFELARMKFQLANSQD